MPRRALVAYSSSSTHVQTTLDYLLGFKKHSGFETSFVHVTHDAKLDFDLTGFDLVFHNYCSRFCFPGYVSEDYQKKLRAFQGLKILAVQDEYDHTNILKAAIKDMGFQIVLTCVPQDSLEYVYPKKEFPSVTFLTVFTGYVTDDFEAGQAPPPPLANRPIVVGYRGRDIGGRYGRLGFDKFEIGRRMKEICDAKGVVNDIAMDESSRIYGTAWFDYLGRCRSMLGSESGSNVFDFDSKIDTLYKKMMAENGGTPPSYEAMLPLVKKLDGAIEMGQISPRVFECAIMRTPMVLFKGRYSDAIKPDEHYISLEKDFSNVDEVLRKLEDIPALEAMTSRAYDHLVASGRFNYATFFGRIAKEASRRFKQTKAATRKSVAASPNGLAIRDWFGYEQPSEFPEKPEMFKMRLSLAEIRLLKGEDDRLSAGFVDHRKNLVTNLHSQIDILIGQKELFDREAGLDPQPINKADVMPEITNFLAKSDNDDESWLKRWSIVSGEVNRALEQNDSAAMPAAVEAALMGVRDRYRVIGEKYTLFGSLYETEMKRLSDLILDVQKNGLKDLTKLILREPREISAIIPVAKQTKQLAGYWVNSAAQRMAIQISRGLRHPSLSGFRQTVGDKLPWAGNFYARMAAIVKKRIGI